MLYALINSSADGESRTVLAWGDVKGIAQDVLYICENELSNLSDGMSLEELEKEYSCYFDDYRQLRDCDEPTKEMVDNFRFWLSDLSVSPSKIANGYPELVKLFDDYAEQHGSIEEWKLIPDLEETVENIRGIASELDRLNDDYCDRSDLHFFKSRYEEEEEEDDEDEYDEDYDDEDDEEDL